MDVIKAIEEKDLIKLEKLLQKNKSKKARRESLEAKDGKGWTAMHHAVANGDPNIICMVRDAGFALNVADDVGFTPLHLAVFTCSQEVVELLLSSGHLVDYEDHKGQTPFHLVCAGQNVEMIELLLNFGASFDKCNGDGKTPLAIACEEGHFVTAKAIINICHSNAYPIIPVYEQPDGSTGSYRLPNSLSPLHLAVLRQHWHIIPLLVEAGQDLAFRTRSGTALELAASRNDYLAVSVLIHQGALVGTRFENDNVISGYITENTPASIIAICQYISSKTDLGQSSTTDVQMLVDDGGCLEDENDVVEITLYSRQYGRVPEHVRMTKQDANSIVKQSAPQIERKSESILV